jgi:catechol-2,3-dioxygenase
MRFLKIHIEVADLERSEEFYTRLLPHATVTRWQDGSAVALVFDDGSAFGLWQSGKVGVHNGRGAEHLHFAFQVDRNELEHFRARMLEMGLDVTEHTWPSRDLSLYFFDPDGH